jgi:natural product biosynthesis luciferase-like monooxygenase protein
MSPDYAEARLQSGFNAVDAEPSAAITPAPPGATLPSQSSGVENENRSDPPEGPIALRLPFSRPSPRTAGGYMALPIAVPETLVRDRQGPQHALPGQVFACDILIAAFAAYLVRLTGQREFDLSVSEKKSRAAAADPPAADRRDDLAISLRVDLDPAASVETATLRVAADLLLLRRKTLAGELPLPRHDGFPAFAAPRQAAPVAIRIDEALLLGTFRPDLGAELVLVLLPDGDACSLVYDRAAVSDEAAATMQGGLGAFLAQMVVTPGASLRELSLLSASERRRILVEWNDTAADTPADLCVHHAIESETAKRPDSIAVQFRGRTLTYRELNERANQLARRLAALGAGPDKIVGLFMERSLDMMVGLLAVLKAGAAYLPLDPAYPSARLSFMTEDAGISVLLTQSWLFPRLAPQANVLCIDTDAKALAATAAGNLATDVTPDHLAYVIYTSGSTGAPKGVMVCHRNVINFFAGMDARIPHDPPGIWLAVTSLSFDISVLELLWTLARGFKVVLHDELFEEDAVPLGRLSTQDGPEVEKAAQAALKPIEMSLFYFASDEAESVADRYHLLLEGAKFADRNGFSAVWTPERHFHAFGGLYPNPSVAGAAIAAVTQRVKIRAGSCVMPLHSPIRVAEEWALVDNLSHGRVGISFASGWQPDDFVIAPQNFATRKEAMFRDIDIVRRLWRGDKIAFLGPTGKEVQVRTLPRPVQQELPVWITAAGNPETFCQAGEMGANLLTHLLGQSIEDLNEKLAAYRQAWRERGHAGAGHVTLMLHSFVGDDDNAVREIVRRPMKEYLRSSIDLIRRAAWTFPPFARRSAQTGKSPAEIFDAKDLSATEMDALLDHAFERYFETSGLFGTPATCAKIIAKIQTIGVDELACLIDFGVDSQQVLDHLDHLKSVKDLAASVAGRARFGILGQIREHGVTHLQCTPSLARIMLADRSDLEALALLRCLMIGGEAFPTSLAEELRPLVKGDLLNMYGPTETTIWSTTHCLGGDASMVPLGRPISNTRLYVLDGNLDPLPPGVPGELFIGGAGVVRGYLNRPDLTADRFCPDPFDTAGGGRLYRTGDLVRYRGDGTLDFLGRLDHQVKIRGHRIELGEIEATLARQPGVREAVVIAREGAAGINRLAAYLVAKPGARLDIERLRGAVKAALPDFMVPAQFGVLANMPLTPNGKIDRTALPALRGDASEADHAAPQGELEATIASVWRDTLNVSRVGRMENFFSLGGDSLLAVVAHRKLCDALACEVAITDIFRFPSVVDLAERIRASKRAADEFAPRIKRVSRAIDRSG